MLTISFPLAYLKPNLGKNLLDRFHAVFPTLPYPQIKMPLPFSLWQFFSRAQIRAVLAMWFRWRWLFGFSFFTLSFPLVSATWPIFLSQFYGGADVCRELLYSASTNWDASTREISSNYFLCYVIPERKLWKGTIFVIRYIFSEKQSR